MFTIAVSPKLHCHFPDYPDATVYKDRIDVTIVLSEEAEDLWLRRSWRSLTPFFVKNVSEARRVLEGFDRSNGKAKT